MGCTGDETLAGDDDDDYYPNGTCSECWGEFDSEGEESLQEILYCTEIHGYVWLGDEPWLTEVELPCLEWIIDLYINCDHVSSVALPALSTVIGDLDVSWCPMLTRLEDCQSVESVGGNLAIIRNAQVTRVEYPALAEVGDDVSITNNDTLDHIDLTSLVSVGRGVDISWNPLLRDLVGLPNLEHVESELKIGNNASLESIEFPSLSTVGDDLYIGHNDSLLDLAGFESLESVGGDLQIRYNPCISQIEAEAFAASITIGGQLSIHHNEGPCL